MGEVDICSRCELIAPRSRDSGGGVFATVLLLPEVSPVISQRVLDAVELPRWSTVPEAGA